jgi:hypothetical protein
MAIALGKGLRIPVVDKDRVKEGRWRTAGRPSVGGLGVELFYATMTHWLALGISAVGDMTFWRDVSEPDVAAKIAPLAELVNVHCRTVHAVARFEARMRADPLWRGERLAEVMPIARRLQDELFEPLAFGCPTIVVDTSAGYVPTIDEVVKKIDRWYPSP